MRRGRYVAASDARGAGGRGRRVRQELRASEAPVMLLGYPRRLDCLTELGVLRMEPWRARGVSRGRVGVGKALDERHSSRRP